MSGNKGPISPGRAVESNHITATTGTTPGKQAAGYSTRGPSQRAAQLLERRPTTMSFDASDRLKAEHGTWTADVWGLFCQKKTS